MLLPACHSWQHRTDRIASASSLESSVLAGQGFSHRSWFRRLPGETLFVFIEGDGVPWTDHGTRIASNPTPRKPLALELAARTDGPVLYVGRPCYFDMVTSAPCIPELWTAARYSERVVDSMAAAINGFVSRERFENVVLVGYSGGGVLAVLIAPHVPTAKSVITLAANLDTEAWTNVHGYLPLNGSLNPAREPALPAGIAEWHAVGSRDTNVPPGLNREYWARIQSDHVLTYSEADHSCCWVDLWPGILRRVAPSLSGGAPATRSHP